MPVPTALIAEDEAVLRTELRARLGHLWPELHVCAEAQNGLEAAALMERHRPDVVFLDIEMPGMTGLDVARRASGVSHVAFITAFDAHAIAAFEQGAIDYVLKPYDEARLALTLERVKQRLGSRPPELESLLQEMARHAPRRDYLRWINASVGNDVRLVTVDEVCYFQAGAGYTRVVTEGGECLIRLALKDLLEQLDPACFWMIHRSTIVNANAIAGVTRDLRGRLSVRLKSRSEKLAVSEAHERLFKQM